MRAFAIAAAIAVSIPVPALTQVREDPPALSGIVVHGLGGVGAAMSSTAPGEASRTGAGADLALEILYRTGSFQAGLAGGAHASALDASAAHGVRFGIAAGAAHDVSPRLRLELMVEPGIAQYVPDADGLFSTVVQSGEAWLPYLGARATLAVNFARNASSFLTVSLYARAALERADVPATVETCFLGCSTSSERFRVGGSVVGLAVGFAGLVRTSP
jgi:hypothetical protein